MILNTIPKIKKKKKSLTLMYLVLMIFVVAPAGFWLRGQNPRSPAVHLHGQRISVEKVFLMGEAFSI